MTLETRLPALLFGARPELRAGTYVLVGGEVPTRLKHLGSVVTDGVRSIVLTKAEADAAELRYPYAASWITVRIPASIKAERLSSTIIGTLREAGIPCVVVAGYAHSHLFVPQARTDDALAVMLGVSRGGAFD